MQSPVGYMLDRNSRERMEDAVHVSMHESREVVIVADGHGGIDAVEYTMKNLPALILRNIAVSQELFINSFAELDEALKQHLFPIESPMACTVSEASDFQPFSDVEYPLLTSGTCVCAAVWDRPESTLRIANLGDCRVVLKRSTGAVQLTNDHNVRNKRELARVSHLVDSIGYIRGLQITRSIGNFRIDSGSKVEGQICDPEFLQIQINPAEDEFIIMSSDGIFDVLSNSQAVDTVTDWLRKTDCPKAAAKALLDRAIARGATDNLCAVVLRLASNM